MDCNQAKQALSDRYAKGLKDEHDIDQALAHCDDCLDCAMFARALASLDTIPRPVAPERTVQRSVDAVHAALAADREAASASEVREALEEPAGTISAEPPIPPAPTPVRLRDFMTGPRLGIAASAAAVFVVAVIGSVQLLTTGVNDVAQDATERVADQPMGSIIDEEAALSADADTGAAEAAEEGTFVARPAPPYVSYEGFVYTVGTETNIAPDGTTVGQVTTARDVAGDVPRAWNVYEDASGTLHMEGSIPGLFSRLTPVTRVYAGQTYGLVSDSPITEFGRWPTLPTAVPEPSSIDGSPGLIQAGTDARGAPIFVRIGGSPADGFAVPPDQTAPDAAGGNPNWTWWEPYSE